MLYQHNVHWQETASVSVAVTLDVEGVKANAEYDYADTANFGNSTRSLINIGFIK
jgi:hypothetical protein